MWPLHYFLYSSITIHFFVMNSAEIGLMYIFCLAYLSALFSHSGVNCRFYFNVVDTARLTFSCVAIKWSFTKFYNHVKLQGPTSAFLINERANK